jgi:hypothetical protein
LEEEEEVMEEEEAFFLVMIGDEEAAAFVGAGVGAGTAGVELGLDATGTAEGVNLAVAAGLDDPPSSGPEIDF